MSHRKVARKIIGVFYTNPSIAKSIQISGAVKRIETEITKLLSKAYSEKHSDPNWTDFDVGD